MNFIIQTDQHTRRIIAHCLPKIMNNIRSDTYATAALILGSIGIILASISPALYDIRTHGIPHTPTYNMTVLLLTPIFLYQWNRVCRLQHPNHVFAFNRGISLIFTIGMILYAIFRGFDAIGNAIIIGAIGNTLGMYILCLHEDSNAIKKT